MLFTDFYRLSTHVYWLSTDVYWFSTDIYWFSTFEILSIFGHLELFFVDHGHKTKSIILQQKILSNEKEKYQHRWRCSRVNMSSDRSYDVFNFKF